MIAPADSLSPPQPSRPGPKVRLIFATYTLLALAISITSILTVYSSVYLSLGLVFATFPIAIAVSIPASMVIDSKKEIAVFALFIAGGLCVPVLMSHWGYWLAFIQLFLLNVALIALVIGLSRLLLCIMDCAFVMTIVLVVAAVWITFPVWGSHLMIGQSNRTWLIFVLDIHPIIASNAIYLDLQEWAHQKLAYRYLTNLGQDVNYSMPPLGALYSILFHGFLSIAFIYMPIKNRPR